MSYRHTALIALLAFCGSALATPALANPATSATGTVGVSLYIPPRIEIRSASEVTGDLCADTAASHSLLNVIAEDGSALQACATLEQTELRMASTGTRTFLVTPV